MQPWTTPDVALSVLRGVRDPASAWWSAVYLAGRRGPRAWRRLAARLATRPRRVRLRGLAAPLVVSGASGGLATWYEIVARELYAGEPGFVPARGATVVDVGANIGVFSLWAAAHVGPAGRLVAIEPHPLAFDHLSAALAGAGVPHDAVAAACGSEPGEAVLHFDPGRLSTGSLQPRPDRGGSVAVAVRPLDAILDELGVGEVDLLKVDVEGKELDVLASAPAALARTRRAVVETDEPLEQRVAAALAEHGLELVATRAGMWGLPLARVLLFARP